MTDEVWAELRQRLIDRREMLCMSQNELAKRSGVTQTTLSALEAGRMKGPPTHKVLVKWAEGLRMTVRVGMILDCPEYAEPYFADLTPREKP